ncbi:RNA polymerase factor sigma-54 [Priestia flexa]|uniref:RNA polymerase factor sigma-54 n=1 Tax=Priestia flexa TaxID=86664 RepID=UPI001CD2A40F|nr:RNA polymerase factor sigma-54 [Priestia flexa]MCA1203689.1 RNA polymerase factor sigma-54 [Priestia flexa]
MQLGLELAQKQLLKLSMTAELRQSINILSYTAADLAAFIEDQASENPLINLTDIHRSPASLRNSHSYTQPYSTDCDYNPFDYLAAPVVTLESHLNEQISMFKELTCRQQHILTFLIGNLDQNGFLTLEAEVVSQLLNAPLLEVQSMISTLQSLDPVGVGARNVLESLLLQIEKLAQKPAFLYDIVKHDIENIAAKKYHLIAKKYSISLQHVQELVDHLCKLNPRPGSAFHNSPTKYIAPDVTVKKVANEYVIVLNDYLLPTIGVDNYYKELATDISCRKTNKYIRQQLNQAEWLLNSVNHRNKTIYNVSKAIVHHQKAFLDHGLSHLKPLSLKDIALELGCHESTVSRATNGKYIQTPRGLFELKFFFTHSVNRSDGDQSTSTAFIKEQLKQLVANENKQKPLSDQKLASLLAHEGIHISRRTVVKYREELGIDSSSKRRRF